MPQLPRLSISAPAQTAIVIAAAAVFLVVLLYFISRALAPSAPIQLDEPLVTDPNSPNEGLPASTQASMLPIATEPIIDASMPPPVVSGVVERTETTTATETAPNGTVIGHDGDTEFERVWPHQLDKITVVAQGLDNQWLTRKMLAQMRRDFSTRALGLQDVGAKREEAGRAEYVRALLNSRQLVVNRVYMYNTSYVAQDYWQGGEDVGSSRGALIELLNKGVIVPFLISESSPGEAPINVETTKAFREWQQLCQEARTHVVRLSWDDAENKVETDRMRRRFTAWLHDLVILEPSAVEALAKSVNIAPEHVPDFRKRLAAVSAWTGVESQTPKGVLRGSFYKEFVTLPGTDVTDGIIDFDRSRKLFASELKQLADLSYATNLPDALGRYALTPMDSLPRTALQELPGNAAQQGRTIQERDLNTLLQREAFSRLSEGLFLSSMAHLTLRDVIELRATDEWAAYTREMEDLLDRPMEFTQRSQAVSQRYIALAERMTERVKRNDRTDLLERWSPVVKLVLTLGTSSLTMWGNPFGAGVGSKILFSVAEGGVSQIANLTARMIIGGVADRSAEAALETSVDFLRGRVEGAQNAWQDIVGKLRSDGAHFEDRTGQPDRSDDELDPNINYQEQIEGIVYE